MESEKKGINFGVGWGEESPATIAPTYLIWLYPLAAISRFGAEALVVSLGLDTFAGDPISGFCLQSTDYLRLGERLARVGLPTVLVLEGGYAVDGLGVNAVNVLQAFA
jgi:acetoin utilization deacetylase AcuC-like enzyme